MADDRTDYAKARAIEGYLVAAARTGDRKALDKLVRLVSPRLLAHAGRLLGQAEGAQDVVQTAWIDIIRGLSSLREVGAFRAFALRIVSRKVAATIKDRQKGRALKKELYEEEPATTAPLGEIAADATSVRDAIDSLSPDHRATLALFYLEDLSIAEVATALDIPQGTVKTRLMHARAQLRAKLKGNDDE